MTTAPTIITHAPNLAALLPAEDNFPPVLPDRARGALLGLACGNLLGLPVEGWSRNAIARTYPGGVAEIDPAEKLRPMDDDLSQAVELGAALLAGGDYIADFARRLVRWREENGRGIGYTTDAVIDYLEQGYPPPEAARLIYTERNRIAPNGGLMRCAPVALARQSDPARLIQDSAATCAVTHYAPACQWSCIIVNAALALLLRGLNPSIADLTAAALADGAPAEMQDRIMAVGDALDDLPLDTGLIGHTLLCLQTGIWALRTPLNFADALVSVVSAGGDTDTNGAVAGAVLGARYGAAAIPQNWQDCIPQRERLEKMAVDLLAPQISGGLSCFV